MDIETIEIKELMNDPANVRKHDERNLDSIKASLLRFGQQKPIVVDGKGIVVAGNGTLMGAKSLGWKEIQIVRTELEGADAVAYAIADNRTAELAVWDEDALAQTLASLQIDDSIDELVTGFTEQEIEELIGKTVGIDDIEEDEVPELPEEAITQVGDLWLLGEHRLLCGDSTSEDDVARLMDGKKLSLMVTDPPYGVNYEGGEVNTKKREKLKNDSDTKIFSDFMRVASVFVPNGAWYIWHAGTKALPVHEAIVANGFSIRALIIWHKLKAGYGAPSSHYCQKHEPCLYCVKGKAGFVGASNECTVWEYNQPRDSKLHPTQKPIECMARPISNHEGDVYDPFMGSGTTLIACEQLNRKCYGMEIDPLYCDVIVKRWENLTGDTAQRVAVDSVE